MSKQEAIKVILETAMNNKKWTISGIATSLISIPVIMFVLQYNPVTNAGEIQEVQQSMKAMEFRMESRVAREDIIFWQDEIFVLEQQPQSPEIIRQIYKLRQRIDHKKEEMADLKMIMENAK